MLLWNYVEQMFRKSTPSEAGLALLFQQRNRIA